ncbi:hypothetical protein HYR54_07725 [Candidatus Acetothermia bacterium]|nr:hypothetical protein [Candidatus Acetothermia bacterium]
MKLQQQLLRWSKIVVILVFLTGMSIATEIATRSLFAAGPPQPLYTLRIQAIPLSDSDGGRAYSVTIQQVKTLINQANLAYAQAGIQFQFDEATDWEPMKDTQLNSLVNGGSNWWTKANETASHYPGKIVIFFRWGIGSNPNGTPNSNIPSSNAFAYPPDTGVPVPPDAPLPPSNINFVGFYNRSDYVSGNIATFVHEIGHYLGLYHTFPGWSDNLTNTPALAAAKLAAAGNSANALDGDLLSDTPPEAGTTYYVNQVNSNPCAGPGSYVINGITFTPDRQNVMSYFGGCQPPYNLSPQQIQRIRATLQHQSRLMLIQVPCFPDFHNLPSERLQTCFDYWVHRGLWPVTLSSNQQGSQIYMSGSFQAGANRPVRDLITAQQYEQAFVDFRAQGFRPGHVNILNIGGSLRFTAIWTPIDGAFESYWGMTSNQYEDRWHQLRSQGYLQTDLFVYQDNGLKFAATWVKKPFTDYASYWGMTSDQYNTRFSQFWNQGLRVIHFVAYRDGEDWRYAAIWEKLPGGWAHYYGMTADQYQQKYNELAAQGLQLYQIHAYGDRFSAVWYKP